MFCPLIHSLSKTSQLSAKSTEELESWFILVVCLILNPEAVSVPAVLIEGCSICTLCRFLKM